MFLNSLYYRLKPLIPRRFQIALRRRIVLAKRARYSHVWPIDERAGKPPEGWTGWPEGKKFALVLTHDVETAEGVEKVIPLAELEIKLGFRSSFNFVAEDYRVPSAVFEYLRGNGFEIGVHGLSHSGNLFDSWRKFEKKASRINHYIKEWKASGFRTPSIYHNLEWISHLDIGYDSSTFDTDPFEPQPDGVGTIFPFWVPARDGKKEYVELPYTLPQDFSLFVLMKEKDNCIWKRKLDWIAQQGGMALLITHPDYINVGNGGSRTGEYPLQHYRELLGYVQEKYAGRYWHALPMDMARYWQDPALSQTALYVDERVKRPRKQAKQATPTPRLPGKKIWIDLDNSPHVPFFHPIINELRSRGHEVILTTRDCSQTCGLADLYAMSYRRIGRHYGKKKVMKVAGTVLRSLQLSRILKITGRTLPFPMAPELKCFLHICLTCHRW